MVFSIVGTYITDCYCFSENLLEGGEEAGDCGGRIKRPKIAVKTKGQPGERSYALSLAIRPHTWGTS